MLEGISSWGDGQQVYSLGCSGSTEASNPDLPHPHPHPRMLTLPIPAGPRPLLPRPQRSTWLMRFQQRVDVTCLWNESRIKHSWHWGGLLNTPPPSLGGLVCTDYGEGPSRSQAGVTAPVQGKAGGILEWGPRCPCTMTLCSMDGVGEAQWRSPEGAGLGPNCSHIPRAVPFSILGPVFPRCHPKSS